MLALPRVRKSLPGRKTKCSNSLDADSQPPTVALISPTNPAVEEHEMRARNMNSPLPDGRPILPIVRSSDVIDNTLFDSTSTSAMMVESINDALQVGEMQQRTRFLECSK